MGKVLSIYLCPDKGLPMQEVDFAVAVYCKGLICTEFADRYAVSKGAWSGVRDTIRHVSLFSEEALSESNLLLDMPYLPIETRRNIYVSEVDLNSLVDQEFFVGGVFMRGVELCAPCARPSKLSGKAGFEGAFANRGGLRAKILSTGQIHPGDSVNKALFLTPTEVLAAAKMLTQGQRFTAYFDSLVYSNQQMQDLIVQIGTAGLSATLIHGCSTCSLHSEHPAHHRVIVTTDAIVIS